MSLKANWSPEEFEFLLQRPQLTDEELRDQMPTRSGAITLVRNFIHSFHTGGDVSGLSKSMMIPRLNRGSWTCPRCGEKK